MARGIFQSLRSVAAPLGVALALAGCGGAFSVSSSMRVEVEVYKGPLTKEPEAQWAELIGIVDEAREMLKKYELGLRQFVMPTKDCRDDPDFEIRTEKTFNELSYIPDFDLSIANSRDWTKTACLQLNNLSRDVAALMDIYKEMVALTPIIGDTLKSYHAGNGKEKSALLVELTRVATTLKSKALFWANVHAAVAPDSLLARNMMTNFANMTSQISNQLSSRADALLKQLARGISRKNLPLSVYLRDTSITDFPNLFVWNRAAAPALLSEMFLHPLHAFSSEETTDRIRVLERLFADHYWTNINTVYASGQGTVRMALIKDDIGNWNLKSFDSNPAKLLNAYKELTLAAVKAVTDAATGGVDKAALDLASRLTRGRIGTEGAKAGTFNVEALRKRTVVKLETLEKKAKDPNANREEILKEARRIVEDYEAVIDVLQESVVAESPKP
ncbi:MAG: hypothetical protein O7D27_03875 [Alphaproteobacteria bacterium]|nr:hypothetical protein [Alphaproteobacteria bacterium]MCZ6608936.1 hypothetical protein [Alphaproteobacteria bacterium]MCZ6741285.1 hypothetical protein [Alphaproteobacteria bacterium]MCZ6814582.1 hypothetical protein [Alphaproteobacteria bacterium]